MKKIKIPILNIYQLGFRFDGQLKCLDQINVVMTTYKTLNGYCLYHHPGENKYVLEKGDRILHKGPINSQDELIGFMALGRPFLAKCELLFKGSFQTLYPMN